MEEWVAAADEHDVISVAELHDAGLCPAQIASCVVRGQLTSLARGWYAATSPIDPEHRHVLTTWAMLRAHEDRTVAAHHSALLLLGLPTYRPDLGRVRLVRRAPGSPRARSGLSVGRAVPVEAQDAYTVSPALAVVQHGLSSGPLSALVAADGALHQGRVTRDDLDRALGWVHQHPRSALIRGFLELADGRRESPGETRLAHLLHLMKVPAIPQFRISDTGFEAIVDFLLEQEKVVLEFDGRVKYSRSPDDPDPFGQRRTPQEVLWLEKRREDRLRELGYEVVRVTWSDLDDPKALARRIAAAVQRARARRLARHSA
jgi:very-short-patch-repair endonuclease